MRKQQVWMQRLLSVPLMLLFILAVYGLKVPNPTIILIIPVVYFTYADGYVSGTLSGATAVLYACYFFLVKTRDPAGGYKAVIIVLAVTAIILLIGRLKAQEAKNTTELKRRGDALVRMATTDKLTGASNRHAFFEMANAIYEDNRRQGTPISLLFIDIDHFKRINDRYGHGFGDAVLIRLSETLHNCLREGDVNCRYGGEEFVLLLANADGDAAQRVAHRVMEEVRGIRFGAHPDFRFTVSIGVSSMVPSDPPRIDLLIRSADDAMYQAKQAGRNQIAVGRPEQGEADIGQPHPAPVASVGSGGDADTSQEVARRTLKNLLEAQRVIRECIGLLYEAKTLNQTMDDVLRRAGAYSGADRAYFFSLSEDVLVLTNAWCAPQLLPGLRVQRVRLPYFYRLWALFDYRECVVIQDIERLQALDTEIYQAFCRQEVRNFVLIPLEQDGKMLGLWGVENPLAEKVQSIAPMLLSLRYFLLSTMQRIEYDALLVKLSFEDSLTGLHNRNCYLRDTANLKAVKNTGVAHVAINEMKRLNDSFGHAHGDQALIDCAGSIKETFSSGRAYRVGGDEFVVICSDISRERFEQQVRALKAHFTAQGHHAAIGCHWTAQAQDIQRLAHEAEAQMYEDKKGHYRKSLPADRYRHYNDDIFCLTEPGSLGKSLDEGHFVLYLQPKVSFSDRRVSGAEALIRYRQSDGTVIAPVQFLPVLEDAKLIGMLDFFVFDRVCAKLAQWLGEGRRAVPVSVNFSRYTLAEQDFLTRLQTVFGGYAIDKKWIIIEVTESVKGVEGMNLLALIDSLRAAGFVIAIDDFGADFANLSLFSSASFDELKVDRTLVGSIVTNQKAQLVIEAVVNICRRMGIRVVAEGVETEEQFRVLKQNGCEQAQGDLFSRPIPIGEYEEKFLPFLVNLP